MTARRALAMLATIAAMTALPLAAAAAPVRPAADAAGANSWAAVAAADGVRVSVEVKDFLVVSNIVDAGGPSAQSILNAFGDSRAYAAYPYPGEIALTAHGLSQGAAPKYPLIAQSDATQPKSDVSTGPYHLHAESADDSSAALAQAGAGGGAVAGGATKSSATTRYEGKTGAVTADAETTVESLSIAGVLSIGRVHSNALMVSMPGKPAQRSSDTEVGDINVGGQQVGLTDKGLVLAGTDIPLPPDSTANAILSSAGVTVHYLAAARTPTSTVAPGLSVGVVQQVPGVGQTTVTYVFGQASATAQATGATSASGLTVTGGGTGATDGPFATDSGSSPASSAGSAAPAPSGQVGAAPPATPPVTAGAPQPAIGYVPAGATGPSSESFYLVIAAGAVVMVAAAQLFRILAVKLAWT